MSMVRFAVALRLALVVFALSLFLATCGRREGAASPGPSREAHHRPGDDRRQRIAHLFGMPAGAAGTCRPGFSRLEGVSGYCFRSCRNDRACPAEARCGSTEQGPGFCIAR